MCQSTGQYGSAQGSNPMRQYTQPSFAFNSPAYNGAQTFAQNQLALMPSFGPRSMGRFGSAVRPAQYQPQQPGGVISDPPGPFQPPPPPVSPGPRGDPAWVFGKGVPPSVQPPPGAAPAVGSPPSAFGMDTAPNPTTQPVGAGYVGQAMSQPPQSQPTVANLAAQSNANMNLWANPFGFSQQQLGPSFNPIGSPQGGFFQGDTYMPNQGNMRNGLDALARFGMNYNGMAR